jgi:hypothetical protein
MTDELPQPAPVDKLRHVLAAAGGLYAASLSSPHHRRAAVMHALNAVYAFLQQVGFDGVDELSRSSMLTPVGALALALADLERGVVSPLLEPRPVPGRPPDLHSRRMVKGAAAAAVTLMMEVGFERKDAAKRIARALRAFDVKLDGNRQLDWHTVASWRVQVKAAPADDEAGFMYRLAMRRMTETPGWPQAPGEVTPHERECFFLDILASLVWLLSHGGS